MNMNKHNVKEFITQDLDKRLAVCLALVRKPGLFPVVIIARLRTTLMAL